MPHFVEDLQAEAQAAIEKMAEAARAARFAHARAELIRHMRTTAAKNKAKPRAEAVELVVEEWMEAWYLPRHEWPQLAREMELFTESFYDYVNDPSDANDQKVRTATAALDVALAAEGTSISDQMAWRSMCAHGWWHIVEPVPADLPGKKDRPTIPALPENGPFWEANCAEQCR